MLVDLFGTKIRPSSAAYHVDVGPHQGSILCLDLAVRYEPDFVELAKVLGDRLQHVTVTEPVFDRKKAEAAIKAGVVTEAGWPAVCGRCRAPPPYYVTRQTGAPRASKQVKPV